MKFLIAGLGSIGRRHLRNLLALGEQDILLYRTHLSTLADDQMTGDRRLSDFPTYTDLDEALKNQVDAVIVSNPTALHMQIAVPAARAGCHLLIEKPISNSLAQIDDLAAAASQSGARILTGFQFRFHPGLQKAAQLISAGAIGSPISARAHWGEYLPDWHPWEDYRQSYSARADLGGGVILTLSHPLDYLYWLVGNVRELWAFTTRGCDLELQSVEGVAEIGLFFTGGTLGSVHLDYLQRPPSHWLEITGTQGTLRWDNASGNLILSLASGEKQEFPAPQGFDRNDMFLAEMRHFIRVAAGLVEPACTLEDGRQALRIGLAALQSAREGCQVFL